MYIVYHQEIIFLLGCLKAFAFASSTIISVGSFCYINILALLFSFYKFMFYIFPEVTN